MYELAITTPFGELGSKAFNEQEREEVETRLLSNLGNLNIFDVELEDGNTLYLSKDMIGRSVFILRKIS